MGLSPLTPGSAWSREGARELKSRRPGVWRHHRASGPRPADGWGRAERQRVGVWTGVYSEFTAPPRPLAPPLPAGPVGDPALGPGRGRVQTDRSPGAPPCLGISPGPGARGRARRLGGPSGPLAVTPVFWRPSPSPCLPPPSFCRHRGSCQDGRSLVPCPGKDSVGTQVRLASRPALMAASLPGLAGLWVSGSCSLHDPAALPPSQRCRRGACQRPCSGVGTWRVGGRKQGMREKGGRGRPLWGLGRRAGRSLTHPPTETGGEGPGH